VIEMLWRVASVATVLMILLLVGAGCSLSPSADFIKALAADQATVSINVVYPYGTIKFCRTNIQNGDVSCGDNGVTVKSNPSGIVVPITVVPQVQMGTPTVTK
jgi:hypothetical protein